MTQLLDKRWSPEQVAHELRERFPDEPERHLSAESIYQGIYDSDVPVTRPAKRRRRRRRRRVQGLERRGRLTSMTMIIDRPAEVDDRVEIGIGRVTVTVQVPRAMDSRRLLRGSRVGR